MSDHSRLLEDPRNAAAITAFVQPRPGSRVVGLHDDVLVCTEVVERTDKYDGMGRYAGTDIVRKPGKPAATVEVVLVTRTGRPYAERYKMTLDQFLEKAAA